MTLYAAPMLKADAWCVRSRFDGQLVASYLNRADAEAIAQRGSAGTILPAIAIQEGERVTRAAANDSIRHLPTALASNGGTELPICLVKFAPSKR